MQESAISEEQHPPPKARPHFLVNVLWSWLVTAVGFLVGFFLNPYIIRHLGEERYGIWALVFSVLDYMWFFDLGFNTAVANFCARFHVKNDTDKINEVVNTALCYFTAVSAILITLAIIVSQNVERLFPNVQAAHRADFSRLMLITGVAWGSFVMLHIFTSCLDGFQRFDLTSRAWTTVTLVRSIGWVVLLSLGYGLVEMGILAVFAQGFGYTLNVINFRRVFPALRISTVFVRKEMIVEMTRYGIPSFLANTSMLLLNQAAPLSIGRFRTMAEVGYFTLPMRLLQTAVDAVSRVGIITRSNVAEKEASGQQASVLRLGIYSNRYCFLLFVPLSMFLLMYGRELIMVWITPTYAEFSYPVMRILVPSIALVMAGQFNSSAILYGLGAHKRYAHGLMLEAALMVIGLIVIVPRFGILGAAWLTAALLLLIRGIYTPWLVALYFHSSLAGYLKEIYWRPLATAVPVALTMLLLKQSLLRGRNWAELIIAGGLITGSYLAMALFTCTEPEHRHMLFAAVGRRWRSFAGGAHA